MSDWLRGECLFDPSPEDIARYGLRNYIPEDEKVLWIGRPTWASYVLFKGKLTILVITIGAMITIGGSPIYYANYIPVVCLIFGYSLVLDWVLIGIHTFYFISSNHIGLVRKKRLFSFVNFRIRRNRPTSKFAYGIPAKNETPKSARFSGVYIFPIVLSGEASGTSYPSLGIGRLVFSYNVNYSSGAYEKNQLNRTVDDNWKRQVDKYFTVRIGGYLGLFFTQIDKEHEDLNKFIGISNVEQVLAVLKQAVMTYWSDRLDAPLSKTDQL